ncbi:MFS transporter [Pediococcus pentosaceus]|uniref:hypothetical protein n=1 Tax=Pediococcus pentosaceus TaxID=1255 RepID=UPI001E637051|nr:hypothetical protein [Pediococcus pentosaceus]
MNKIRHQFDQLVQGEYREAFILILGMIVMLIGEFSTALAVTKIVEAFGNNEVVVQLTNILPLAWLALMYPLGPVWLQKKSVVQLLKLSLAIFMIGSLLVGIAFNMPILLLGRIIQTTGVWNSITNASEFNCDNFTRKKCGFNQNGRCYVRSSASFSLISNRNILFIGKMAINQYFLNCFKSDHLPQCVKY